MTQRKQEFFLDTSTQVSKYFEDEPLKLQLLTELANSTCYSSVYVKNQYKYLVINKAIVVHTILQQCKSIQEARKRLKDISRDENDLVFNIFSRIAERYDNPREAIRRLEAVIEYTWKTFFNNLIQQPLINITNCVHAKDDPTKKLDGKYYNLDSNCPSGCHIESFWDQYRNDLITLKDIGAKLLKHTNDPQGKIKKIKDAATEIFSGNRPQGDNCKVISDAVIAIEARESDSSLTVHSMDADFKTLELLLKVPVKVFNKHRTKPSN